MLEKDADAATSTAARNKLPSRSKSCKKKHVELLAYDENSATTPTCASPSTWMTA
jgi:hypothetical protein